MPMGLFDNVAAIPGSVRYKRSEVPLPSCHRPLKEKICGCRIGTPVVIRETSTPAARSSFAKASRNSFGSVRLRASVISQRMTGWVSSLAPGFNTMASSTLPLDPALQRGAGRLAMLRCDVARHQPDRGREHGRVIREAEHRQHVRNKIERQDEIGDRP